MVVEKRLGEIEEEDWLMEDIEFGDLKLKQRRQEKLLRSWRRG